MNKRLLLTVIINFLIFNLRAQNVDYMDIRSSLTNLSCGIPDSILTEQTRCKLESFDTSTISKNLLQYYQDLGMCYYTLYLLTNKNDYFKMYENSFHKSLFHDPKNSEALWSCAFYYFISKDCVQGKQYLKLYKKYTKKRYIDYEQIERLLKNCST